MTKTQKSWGKFIVDGSLSDTGDGSRTVSGMNFLKSLPKIPQALLQQVKQNRLAVTLSQRPSKDLQLGQRLGLGPRPTPGPGSPYSPFGSPPDQESEEGTVDDEG